MSPHPSRCASLGGWQGQLAPPASPCSGDPTFGPFLYPCRKDSRLFFVCFVLCRVVSAPSLAHLVQLRCPCPADCAGLCWGALQLPCCSLPATSCLLKFSIKLLLCPHLIWILFWFWYSGLNFRGHHWIWTPQKREVFLLFHLEEERVAVLVAAARLKLLWKSKLGLWDQTLQWHCWRSLLPLWSSEIFNSHAASPGLWKSFIQSWHCHCLPQYICLQPLAKHEHYLVILSKQDWGLGELWWLCVLILKLLFGGEWRKDE